MEKRGNNKRIKYTIIFRLRDQIRGRSETGKRKEVTEKETREMHIFIYYSQRGFLEIYSRSTKHKRTV